MSPKERDDFLSGVRPAVFSSARSDGRIHSVVVWYAWDGSAFTVLTDRGSVKDRNVRRVGRATIVVHEDINYVSAEGPVVVRDPVGDEERLALWTRYYGEETARQIVTPGSSQRLVALVLTPERLIEVPAG
ncbi:MAG TPA: pyridoxamine 5'-phosphate oxidase family protein [Candidatus Solibacter sp.]|nr:pyridoxamine 5'-phosphate oxidase family protein [Candidatus Solibacter sp.]